MTADAARAARIEAGIPDTAPRFRRGVTMNEVLRTKWERAARLPRLNDWSLDDLTRSLPEPSAAAITTWIDAWVDGRTTKGLLLVGPPGHGKTTLAGAILRECIQRTPRARLGWTEEATPHRPVIFVPWLGYIEALQVRMSSDQVTEEELEDAELLVTTVEGHFSKSRHQRWAGRLVCLDDVGREYRSRSGWSKTLIDHVMRSRDGYDLTTMGTSNVPLDEWEERYGQAAASFAHQVFTEVLVFSKDHRR